MEKLTNKEVFLTKKVKTLREQADKYRLLAESKEIEFQKAEQELLAVQKINNQRQQKEAETPNKVKKTNDIPARKLPMAILGVKIAQNWQNTFRSLQVPNVQHQALAQNAAQLLNLVNQADTIVTNKQLNTVMLDTVNKQIDKAVGELKTSLKVFHPKANLESIYRAHGLNANHRGFYTMLGDNSIRVGQLETLVNKIQDPNNPIINLPSYDLRKWLDLQQQQAQLWAESERLREDRSMLILNINNLHTLVENDIKRVHAYMSFYYDKNEVKRQRRAIGFLKESL